MPEAGDGGAGGDEPLLLFSYGSNLCTPRLRSRAPSAQVLGRAVLEGHDLRFHKESDVDGSGKADAFRTGRAGDAVRGALARLSPEDHREMDRVEGVGAGYRARTVRVRSDRGEVIPVRTYVAEARAVKEGLRPFSWYLELVVAGAREHGLPPGYVDRLSSVPSARDPDPERRRSNLAVLE